GYVDHQTLSSDAYLKFIEDDFLGGARLDPDTDGRPDSRPSVRENELILGDLAADFDFGQPPRPPMLLPTNPPTDSPTIPAYLTPPLPPLLPGEPAVPGLHHPAAGPEARRRGGSRLIAQPHPAGSTCHAADFRHLRRGRSAA